MEPDEPPVSFAPLQEMIDGAAGERDLPMETLCLILAMLLGAPEQQGIDPEFRKELARLGSAMWRHTDEFRDVGTGQTRQ